MSPKGLGKNWSVGDCDCCRSEEVYVQRFERAQHIAALAESEEDKHWNVCRVCSTTYISTAFEYDAYREQRQLFLAIAQCTNMILKEMGR